MRPKENQRIALTKRLLRESLLRLMEEKSIQSISVKELCEASGINRSTFYNHYARPADVLAEIENKVIADLQEVWEKEAGKNWPLDRRIEALCGYIDERRRLFRLLLQNSDTTEGFASLIMNTGHVRMSYEKTFSYAKEESDRLLMSTFLSNGAYYMIRQWVLEDIPKTPKEMGELVYFIATRGWERPADRMAVTR